VKTGVGSVEQSEIKKPESAAMRSSLSILVVGDETGFFGYLSDLSPWSQCHIEVVANSEDAAEQIKKKEYSLVILCGEAGSGDRERWESMKELVPSTPFFHLDKLANRKDASGAEGEATDGKRSLDDPVVSLPSIVTHSDHRDHFPPDSTDPDRDDESVKRTRLGALVGVSSPMQEAYEKIQRASEVDCVVLLQGESGTGKELAARAIHRYSHRREFPFIPVNCSAIPDNLLESELFGYVRGAFSGAVANTQGILRTASGGTVFFDEIGELSRGLQAKLLRFVEDKVVKPLGSNRSYEIDVRIIVATNVDLKEEVHKGGFRRDLYYRISVLPIFMPPLREKKEDIPLLVNHFLEKYGDGTDRTVCGVSSQVMTSLFQYEWPGNVREIENLIQHAIVMGSSPILTTKDLPARFSTGYHGKLIEVGGPNIPTLREMEEKLIRKSLRVTKGNISSAARILGVDRKTIYRKMKRFSLHR
jgi:DNA-binding NtrC family response regulator